MPLRRFTPALLWLPTAALLALLLLLWPLRSGGGLAIDLALLIAALLLPVPLWCWHAWRRSTDLPATPRVAAEARARFLAQIGHEIRTPMSTVMGMTQLTLQTPLNAEQREWLTRADAASHALLGLVNDVLDLAKVKAGQMRIESRPLCMEDVVAQAIESVRPLHANPAVALVCDWADATLLSARGHLLGDATRLQQVLASLLSQALKCTPAGQVLLRLAAHPSDAQGRVPLRLTVQDSGSGSGPDAEQLAGLERLREYGPANTAEVADAPAPVDSLSLQLTQGLVELMGGTLDARRQAGCGSSFEIHLTLPPALAGSLPPPLGPQRLLLAQAHADSRDATLALLRHLGLGTGLAASTDAHSTQAALADAHQAGQPFDWLLLDGQLPGPGATGVELLAQLRRSHPALRIAVLCPPGASEAAAACRAFGARALCPTPLLPGELRHLLTDPPGERPAGGDTLSLAGLRVLLVEDHPINQEIAVRLLGGRGAHVDVAGDGQQGLERLQAAGPEAYDLVLMDLQMPVLDGLSATRRLRELPGFAQLPVLAMTAHALPEEKAQCLEAGMQGHIAKPLDVARLVRELQRYRPATTPASPALDLQLGLQRFDGQTALYRRTLQGFAAQYADGLATWPAWLQAADWAALRRAAHTLQGLAATLGAQPLHQAALRLERSAAAGDVDLATPQLSAVRAELDRLLEEMDTTLNSRWDGDGIEPEATPRTRGPAPLDELQQLLSQSDSQALDWWQAHGAHSGLTPALRQHIGAALAALDFDAAALALAAGRNEGT